MSRRLPPLNALRMFEVVARTGNLTTAAAELHVTQSAVIVYYSPDPVLARSAILQYGWFEQGEVELIT